MKILFLKRESDKSLPFTEYFLGERVPKVIKFFEVKINKSKFNVI